MDDGRALTEAQIKLIEENVFAGRYSDVELARLFVSLLVQRRVLRELFNLFKREPFRRVSVAEPLLNSQLTYFKELVSMEDPPRCPTSPP